MEVGLEDLAGGVDGLECFELPLQLAQRKREIQLRRNEQRLNEEHRPEKNRDAGNEQELAH